MKYLVLVLAFATVLSMMSSEKIRIHLEEVSQKSSLGNNVAQDMFFQTKKRKVYVHDNQVAPGKGLFAAKVLVGSSQETLALDTLSDKSWFSGDKTTVQYVADCQASSNKACNVVSTKAQTSFNALNYLTGGHVTVNKAVALTNSVTLLNKRPTEVTKVSVDYTQAADVLPKKVMETKSFSGVLGLGLGAKSNLVNQLKANKLITNRVFAFFFAQESVDNEMHAFLTVGDYEKYLCTDDLSSKGVNQDYKTVDANNWAVQMGTVQLGNSKSVDVSSSNVVFDTSSYEYWAPSEFLTALLADSHFKSCTSTKGVVSCSAKLSTLPTIKVKLHGQKRVFDVKPTQYARVSTDGKFTILNWLDSGAKGNFVFGRQWLANFYTVFDMENSKVFVTPVYLTHLDTWKMSNSTRWMVIAFGTFFLLLTVFALIAILKPITNTNVPRQEVAKQSRRPVREEVVKQSKKVEPTFVEQPIVQQQPQYVYVQQPVLQSSLVRQQSPMMYNQQQPVVVNNQFPLGQSQYVEGMSPPRYR